MTQIELKLNKKSEFIDSLLYIPRLTMTLLGGRSSVSITNRRRIFTFLGRGIEFKIPRSTLAIIEWRFSFINKTRAE